MTPTDSLNELRASVVQHLRNRYLGPALGEEEVLADRPDRIYLVGTLYPRGPAERRIDGDVIGEEGHDDELDEPVELANSWHPASAAISFLLASDQLSCTVTTARYERVPGESSWRRIPLRASAITIDRHDAPVDLFDNACRLVAVWRPLGDAWLVTVAIENLAEHDNAESPPPTENCLFQVHLRCDVAKGEVRPYPSVDSLSNDPEDVELQILYRNRKVYGVGHGCSVTWDSDGAGKVVSVATEMLPTTAVPGVWAGDRTSEVLNLAYLCDESISLDDLTASFNDFIALYETWIDAKQSETLTLESKFRSAADRLTARMKTAANRMREGVAVLRAQPAVLTSFRLANAAMRLQMLQSRHIEENPGKRGVPLELRSANSEEPGWYPFQLAFQLLTIASVTNPDDDDRKLVDLIWFPTGGGKTEAYLAVAATEMIHRRLTRGVRGGGTAVITRYTLRMLTSQQFQRAATLICALERIRAKDERLAGCEPFTIGLWVGEDTTPNSFAQAKKATDDLVSAQTPEGPFQINACPWCATPLFPKSRAGDRGAYGVRSTKHSFELHCTHGDCDFADLLPVLVVDDQIFANPPTLLVATVDKYARVPWSERAGALFGHGVPYDPAGLVIQDELHLLSGPLGTTVAIYEAAVLGLLSWTGKLPKVIASTATIRSAAEQISQLYGGREVALFPPSGLDAEDSFFSRVDESSPGRLYLGLMPQAHTATYAAVLACAAILEAPRLLAGGPQQLDAYWTLVAYHNSLRELGRTITAARDDVSNLLNRRSEANPPGRTLRPDAIIELTSNVNSNLLAQHMKRLEKSVDQGDAIDLVATTNMLSVGIDIRRLGVMLMNGQPKTTAEYIQATSRVGRSKVPGLVIALLRANKPRDRSHYEFFRGFHESLYRFVEPTSVTPWSLPSRERSLHASLVMLMRNAGGLTTNDSAGAFRADSPVTRKAVDVIQSAANEAEPTEREGTSQDLKQLVAEWDRRAVECASGGIALRYTSSDKDYPALLCQFGERREGWPTLNNMRSVDRQVRVIAMGESLS